MQMLRRFAFIALLFTMPLCAAPYVNISKSTTYPFPDQILVGAQGAGDYVVQNNYGADLKLYVVGLPKGAERLNAIDLPTGAPADCGTGSTISLAAGASCTLRIGYASSTIGVQVFDNTNPLALVCKTSTASQYCSALPSTTVLTTEAPSDETSLEISKGDAHFAPGETSQIDITNTGDATANNVRLFLPAHMVEFLDDDTVTACASLDPGATCHLQIGLEPQTPTHGLDATMLAGAGNALPIYEPIRMYNSLLTITPASFVKPGEAAITLTNNGQVDVTNISIDDVSSVSTIHGVTPITSNAVNDTPLCTTSTDLEPGKSCEFLYSILASSYGRADLNVYFTPQGSSAKTLGTVMTIQKVKPVINPNSEDVGQPVTFDPNATDKSFLVKNTSKFTWYAPQVAYSGNNITLLTDQAGDCSATGMPDGVPSGGTCKVRYEFSSNKLLQQLKSNTVTSTTSGTVSATGTNAQSSSASTAVTGAVNFSQEPATHVGYTALKMTNGENVALQLYEGDETTGIVVNPDQKPTQVNWCGNLVGTDNACDSAFTTGSDVCQIGATTGTVLAANGGSCLLWFKALPSNKLTDNTEYNYGETISIVMYNAATGDGTEIGTDWGFRYNYELYIGGSFQSGDGDAKEDYLMQYNGNTLEPVGGAEKGQALALDGEVDALHMWQGDLYVGGQFSTTDGDQNGGIVVWNGSGWNRLGQGLQGSKGSYDIDAIADNTSSLIVGGDYRVGDAEENIGKWDGSQWQDFSGSFSSYNANGKVQSIAVDGAGNIDIGGNFTGVTPCLDGSGRKLYYFAMWTGNSDNCWQPKNTENQPSNTNTWLDMDNAVYAMLDLPNYSKMMVGGEFSNVYYPVSGYGYSSITAQAITSYSYSTSSSSLGNWLNIAQNQIVGVEGHTNALTSINYQSGSTSYEKLFVGGWFSRIGGAYGGSTDARNVVELDPKTGTYPAAMGSGLDNQVNALAALYDPDDTSDPLQVYAGGDFTNRIEMYNGNNWQEVNESISCGIFSSCNVYALAFGASVESAPNSYTPSTAKAVAKKVFIHKQSQHTLVK